MEPSLFGTHEEILKKLRAVAKVHSFADCKVISHIFYDVFKLGYYAIKRKKAGLKKCSPYPVTLRRKDVTRIVKLVDYFHCNDKEFEAGHDLKQCFGYNFTESDACRFFEKFVEGTTKDRFGSDIYIDLEDGIKFMYKDYSSGQHTRTSEYYLPHRGKRLPWISHTIHNSSNIYCRKLGKDKELMYMCKYNLAFVPEEEKRKCYWVVIVKRYAKDKTSPYRFKTAFPIFRYNDLLRRIEKYTPCYR